MSACMGRLMVQMSVCHMPPRTTVRETLAFDSRGRVSSREM